MIRLLVVNRIREMYCLIYVIVISGTFGLLLIKAVPDNDNR